MQEAGIALDASKSLLGNPVSIVGVRNVKSQWRLLWRGCVVIGDDGWHLEGVAFFSNISFGRTSLTKPVVNPFEIPASSGSPFLDLYSNETDLCLSLETQRGRPSLRYRGTITLEEDEELRGSAKVESCVQMQIATTAYHTQQFFRSKLCRLSALTASGRTRQAIVIGLDDEDLSPNSSLIVYGQAREVQGGTSRDSTLPLVLLVARRQTRRLQAVRPGEPLPRDSNRRRPLSAEVGIQRDDNREMRKSRQPPIREELLNMRSLPVAEVLDRQVLDHSTAPASRKGMDDLPKVLKLPPNVANSACYKTLALRQAVTTAINSAMTRVAPHLHPVEKEDIFKMTLQGTEFALRRQKEEASSNQLQLSQLVQRHLEMYI